MTRKQLLWSAVLLIVLLHSFVPSFIFIILLIGLLWWQQIPDLTEEQVKDYLYLLREMEARNLLFFNVEGAHTEAKIYMNLRAYFEQRL